MDETQVNINFSDWKIIEKLNNINMIFEGYSVMPVLSMACFAGGERG